MQGNGKFAFSDTAYNGSTEIDMNMGDGESIKMKQTFSAKRLSDCESILINRLLL